ncbi:MAG TPA: universal stress protein, partial [Candidatus Binatia bacterium]|nr:universal stress protein [Candidatus Binatia bacterium]
VYGVPYGAYSAGEGFYDPTQLDKFVAQLRNEAEEYLEQKAAELKGHGVDKVSYDAKEGIDADEIISFARHLADNLIVMCTHGRSGINRWVLGSVTETVVRHSDNPVLVIRGPGDREFARTAARKQRYHWNSHPPLAAAMFALQGTQIPNLFSRYVDG